MTFLFQIHANTKSTENDNKTSIINLIVIRHKAVGAVNNDRIGLSSVNYSVYSVYEYST